MAYINAVANTNKGVRTLHPDYQAMIDKWKRCRDAIAGKDAIVAANQEYLPKLREQTQQEYLAYLKRANWYNASARTVSGLLGMLFRKPPTKNIPPGLDNNLLDVDLCGTPFDVFAQEIAEQCLEVGRVGILVDHQPAPKLDTVITKAVAEKLGLRPTLKYYTTENIINWKFKLINKVYTLCQVVLHELFVKPDLNSDGTESEFFNVTEDRWRVLDLEDDIQYRVRVFRINTAGEDEVVSTEYPLLNGKSLNYIPFLVITEDGVSFEVEEPPLLDLIDVNLSHFRSSADYEHGCHFTALPTLFIAGMEAVNSADGKPVKIYLGSQAAILAADPDCKAEFIEFKGDGLSTIAANMDRKEQQMAILGARMLATEGKQAQTATTTAIHRTGENANLASISIAVSLGLQKALNWFAAWAGIAAQCEYDLNRDFLPLTVDGPTLTAVTATWQAGGMSDEEYFDWLQRGDIIEAEMTFEEHKAQSFQDPQAKALALATALPDNPPTKPGEKTPIKANPEKK